PGVLGRTGDEVAAVLRPPRCPQGRLRQPPVEPGFFGASAGAGDTGNAAGSDPPIGNDVGAQTRRNRTDAKVMLADDETRIGQKEKEHAEGHGEDDSQSDNQQQRLRPSAPQNPHSDQSIGDSRRTLYPSDRPDSKHKKSLTSYPAR